MTDSAPVAGTRCQLDIMIRAGNARDYEPWTWETLSAELQRFSNFRLENLIAGAVEQVILTHIGGDAEVTAAIKSWHPLHPEV